MKSKIKIDPHFINKLLYKLKIGDRRSIHLNAIPGRLNSRLDLFDLFDLNQQLPLEFLQTLLGQASFKFKIGFRGINIKDNLSLVPLERRLKHLVNQDREMAEEFGQHSFGFGYPLLIKHDKEDYSKISVAPLIIWRLGIKQSGKRKNEWLIERQLDDPIKLNEVLISHIAKDEQVSLPQLPNHVLEDGVVSQTELIDLCQDILSRLGSNEQFGGLKITKCLNRKEFEAAHNINDQPRHPWIHFSGIFGLYKNPKEAIIQATETVLHNSSNLSQLDLELRAERYSTVASVAVNPSQEEIIDTLERDEFKLIQGPPGTGKSQSITAIISNALANGKKCLLICEKKVALEVVQEKLKEIGLDGFVGIIDDVDSDRRQLVEKAREIQKVIEPATPSASFGNYHQEFTQTKQDYARKHQAVLDQILGNKSRKHLIGKYYQGHSQEPSFGDFLGQLNAAALPLNFETNEHFALERSLEEVVRAHIDIPQDAHHCFAHLNNSIFTQTLDSNLHQRISSSIAKNQQLAKEAMDFLSRLKNHPHFSQIKHLLIKFKPNQLTYISQLLASIKTNLQDAKQQLLAYCEQSHSPSYAEFIKKPGWFSWSAKSRQQKSDRKQFAQKLKLIHDGLKQLEQRNFNLPNLLALNGYQSYDQIMTTLDQLEKTSSGLKIELDYALGVSQSIIEFGQKVQQINNNLWTIDNSPYTKPLVQTTNPIEELYGHYVRLSQFFAACQQHSGSFDSYHRYQSSLRQNPTLSVICQSLLTHRVPPNKWQSWFNTWYYRQTLERHESSVAAGFHTSSDQLQKLCDLSQELTKLQGELIDWIWSQKRQLALSDLQIKFNTLYNLRGSKGRRRNSLRYIVEANPKLFTAIFPVIFANPSTACTLFHNQPNLFDYVIFDEASQLRIEDTFANLLMGRVKIVSGDEHQMPPSSYFTGDSIQLDYDEGEGDLDRDESDSLANSESLLQYCEDLLSDSSNKSYLDYHYRSQHPDLIAFSNNAFYQGRLIARPAKQDYPAIDFANIAGTYYRGSAGLKHNTNPEEAAEVIRILKEDIEAINGQYPSVGIVTFNIFQRNLIYELIDQAVAKDPNFARKHQSLNPSLFVRNLENVQGDERDIIIISTTFGCSDDGRFIQNFGQINQKHGYKLLNVLITRAKHKLYVRTSIPAEYYQKSFNHTSLKGSDYLYASLYYFQLIADGNRSSAKGLLESLIAPRAKLESMADQNLTESPFEDEVLEDLQVSLPQAQIKVQHQVGGYRVDFLIDEDLVLECDGKTYHKSEQAWRHDAYRQQELETMGYIVYRIWSTNWFRDKNAELAKFLQFYQEHQQTKSQQAINLVDKT